MTDASNTCRGGENAYTDPYRLYNLDVFEYEADSEMALVSARCLDTTVKAIARTANAGIPGR